MKGAFVKNWKMLSLRSSQQKDVLNLNLKLLRKMFFLNKKLYFWDHSQRASLELILPKSYFHNKNIQLYLFQDKIMAVRDSKNTIDWTLQVGAYYNNILKLLLHDEEKTILSCRQYLFWGEGWVKILKYFWNEIWRYSFAVIGPGWPELLLVSAVLLAAADQDHQGGEHRQVVDQEVNSTGSAGWKIIVRFASRHVF